MKDSISKPANNEKQLTINGVVIPGVTQAEFDRIFNGGKKQFTIEEKQEILIRAGVPESIARGLRKFSRIQAELTILTHASLRTQKNNTAEAVQGLILDTPSRIATYPEKGIEQVF